MFFFMVFIVVLWFCVNQCVNRKLMNTYIGSVLYTSKTLSNGEHPLMLRLTKNRKRKYISLHLSLPPQYWDFNKGKPKRNCPNREQIIQLIEKKTKELQEQVMDFKTNDRDYTLYTLVNKASKPIVRQIVGRISKHLYRPPNCRKTYWKCQNI